MKEAVFPPFPDDMVVYAYPETRFPDTVQFSVPPGFEALLVRDGELSEPYREGDSVFLGGRAGGFGLGRKALADIRLYLCRKTVGQPLLWGVGDIPAPGGEAGLSAFYGANGSLLLSVENSAKLVRRFEGGGQSVDLTRLGRLLEGALTAAIRAGLQVALRDRGLDASLSSREQIAEGIRLSLAIPFSALGLRPEVLVISEIMPTGPTLRGQE